MLLTFLPRLASFRISYIPLHRPHQRRAIGFRADLTCRTVMAPPSSAPSASASGGRRKRARTQTEETAHDSQTTTTTPPTRRSQRAKLTNTSVPDQTKAIPVKQEDSEGEEPPKVANKKASRPRAKPKPAKSEDVLDDAKLSPSSTSASKEAVKQEDSMQARETGGFWLMKSEPDAFSYEDLCKHDGPAGWDGVRNHVAKKHLMSMKVGDRAFFYHSNCKEPGIVGVMEITRDASIDESQFDPQAKYYDSKATTLKPRWYLVHCSPIRKLGRQITLAELRTHSGGALKEMALFRQTRLSVSPVSAAEFQFILDLENKPEGKDTD
ncbi:hypothetical protein TWF730_009938 [Orbilia blumenaviensis]|uniref:EVE domain-containing protein n=1 Tax=Orbilia blumenaviensis TaxID=1796055 RepID=A0AAV9UUM3_9PEZI